MNRTRRQIAGRAAAVAAVALLTVPAASMAADAHKDGAPSPQPAKAAGRR